MYMYTVYTNLIQPSASGMVGALQRGPCGPWSTQNFGWVGHNAFGPTNNWHVYDSLIVRKISKIAVVQLMWVSCVSGHSKKSSWGVRHPKELVKGQHYTY